MDVVRAVTSLMPLAHPCVPLSPSCCFHTLRYSAGQGGRARNAFTSPLAEILEMLLHMGGKMCSLMSRDLGSEPGSAISRSLKFLRP